MLRFVHRSILIQLLSMYLLFVTLVLIAGASVNTLVEQRLRDDAQASDQALAQEIALETSARLQDAENSLVSLATMAMQTQSPDAMLHLLSMFQAIRSDVDYVSWLDPFGGMLNSWPHAGWNGYGTEFSPTSIIEQARIAKGPVFEVGIAMETNLNAGVIIAEPARTANGTLVGIIVANISIFQLSKPLTTVVQAQQNLHRHLMISIIDKRGELVGTPQHNRILDTVLDELPGAEQALQNHIASQVGRGSNGEDWLYSAVPVPNIGWAVVVQRPVNEALAVVVQFHLWLLIAALIFAIGGLLFWLILLNRFIRPLHQLAIQHQAMPDSLQAIPTEVTTFSVREDEVGALARSFIRLERDGLKKLSELRTLLETSNAVVGSLEPQAVVKKIIHEVQRLVDVQAAAVLLPDKQGVLRVLVSSGHTEQYDQNLTLPPENPTSSAVQALRNGKPMQKLLLSQQSPWPSFSYDEGFRTVMAIPIISRYVGSVVLQVHRTEAKLFEQNEIDLLLMFANYATLAWEHAVLYERSDERLREIARENEQLYQQAWVEKQKLEAIIGSMSDGLILAGIEGTVLYSNTGAGALVGLSSTSLESQPISILYDALQAVAIDPAECKQMLKRVAADEIADFVIEIKHSDRRCIIHVRQFDVGNESGRIGRGILLRDVTREKELDEFKTTLLAAVGHELRTPLAAIKGHASTLLQEDVSWSLEDQRHFLQTISSEADRLALLVSNLLDLSRQEAGLLLLNRAPVKIQDLVSRALENIRHGEKRIALKIPQNLPYVYIDQARIEVALSNLITNALVYSDGEVQIKAEAKNDVIILSVTDNGPGITPDELPHIFERFYRARHGRQQRSGGTGLGLTICKAFVEAHKSKIWVEGNEYGTTFSFSLPPVKSQIAIEGSTVARSMTKRR